MKELADTYRKKDRDFLEALPARLQRYMKSFSDAAKQEVQMQELKRLLQSLVSMAL